jgi:hypothetical protein
MGWCYSFTLAPYPKGSVSEQATPFARTMLPSLVPGQPYEISLDLDIPVSPDNIALGQYLYVPDTMSKG